MQRSHREPVMRRPSRLDDLLVVALEVFQKRGFEATPIADILDALGATQSAYQHATKDQLLVDLVEPLLDDIDEVLNRYPRHPSWPGEGSRLLSHYLDVLIAHRDLVAWIDRDTAVLYHPAVGKRLADSNQRLRAAIRGDNRSTAARLGASAALGTMWRPLRNLTDLDVHQEKETLLAAALAVVETVRSS